MWRMCINVKMCIMRKCERCGGKGERWGEMLKGGKEKGEVQTEGEKGDEGVGLVERFQNVLAAAIVNLKS